MVKRKQMIDRIIRLTYLLSTSKSINISDFSKKEKVSKRTIKRDLNKIDKIIPLKSFREKNNTISFCRANIFDRNI